MQQWGNRIRRVRRMFCSDWRLRKHLYECIKWRQRTKLKMGYAQLLWRHPGPTTTRRADKLVGRGRYLQFRTIYDGKVFGFESSNMFSVLPLTLWTSLGMSRGNTTLGGGPSFFFFLLKFCRPVFWPAAHKRRNNGEADRECSMLTMCFTIRMMFLIKTTMNWNAEYAYENIVRSTFILRFCMEWLGCKRDWLRGGRLEFDAVEVSLFVCLRVAAVTWLR
jgi:hypothetical protein